jgi:hypothetical protein
MATHSIRPTRLIDSLSRERRQRRIAASRTLANWAFAGVVFYATTVCLTTDWVALMSEPLLGEDSEASQPGPTAGNASASLASSQWKTVYQVRPIVGRSRFNARSGPALSSIMFR